MHIRIRAVKVFYSVLIANYNQLVVVFENFITTWGLGSFEVVEIRMRSLVKLLFACFKLAINPILVHNAVSLGIRLFWQS